MMADGDNSKDWPTLTDSNSACSSGTKSKQVEKSKVRRKLKNSSDTAPSASSKEICEVKPDVTNGADGCENVCSSTNSNKTGARSKKQSGKTKWSPAPADLLSYRDNRYERHHNDSHRFAANGRRFNNHESSNYVANGHENSRGRPSRGGRGGRGHTQFRPRRESAVNSDYRRYQKQPQEAVSSTSRVGGAENLEDAEASLEGLKEQVKLQIEYYFSTQNLVRDPFLRRNLDDQGYAQLSLLATFPRIKRLTKDLGIILEAVKRSSHLEVCDDVKVRPVVDPLRWPLKESPSEAANLNTSGQYVDNIMSALFYNMTFDPSVYQHIPDPKSLMSGIPWQYIPVDNYNKNVFCMANGMYHPVDSNDINVNTDNSDVLNDCASSSEQLNSPSSDLSCELTSQFMRSDYQLQNSAAFCPLNEVPCHVESNGVNSVAEDSTIPNGHIDSDQASSQSIPKGEICRQYVESESESDLQGENDPCWNPAGGICHHFASKDTDTSAGDSDRPEYPLVPMQKFQVTPLNSFARGVIMFNSGGRGQAQYYTAPSNDIMANSVDSSEDNSTLHNKSPEPSR